MADPIWVDSSVIGDIAEGDLALEAELLGLAKGGDKLMVPKVREEATLGNPFQKEKDGKTVPAMGPTPESAKREEVIKRLSIRVDMMGDQGERRRLFETQFKFKGEGKPTVTRAIEESDAIILSQIAASAKARNISNPRFFTSERRLANNADAKLWKVAILGRASAPMPPGFSGRISPTGDVLLNLTPSARGQANGAAMVAAFMIVDGLVQYLNSRFLSSDIDEQLSAMAATIRNWQLRYPADGALVSVNFARTELAPDPFGVMKNRLLIHPTDTLEDVEVFFAPTPEAAARQLRGQKYWLPGDTPNGPYQTVRTRSVFWVAPRLREVAPSGPEGRWRVQVDRWTWIYEFKPGGEVVWKDPFNHKTGKGRWTMQDDHVAFKWPSGTAERWDLPLSPSHQSGTCRMKGEGTFPLSASKL